MKKSLLISLLCMLGFMQALAQVTSTPSPLTQNATGVVIYYHADEGNKGLINQPENSPIYAHTGVLTSTSSGSGDWKYASSWGDNNKKYELQYVSPNLWKLEIGNINEYYGITDPNVVVTKLAFVFRNADKSKEGKTANNGDIFLDVFQEGLHLTLSSDIAGNMVTEATKANFTASTTMKAEISISVNGNVIASAKDVTTLTAPYTLAEAGSYNVKAVAVAGDETVTAEEVYTFLAASKQQDYPGGVPVMGQKRNSDGSVTFCLGAPLKNSVNIVGSWNDFALTPEGAMKYQDYQGYRYFWTTIPNLSNTEMYMYYFLVDGAISVGDPYAKLVLDPSNDKYIPADVYPNLPAYPYDKVNNVPLAIYQGNINDYNWKVKDFHGAPQQDLIIYELLLRDFTGTEGQALGNGNVNLAIEKIPYLKSLNINAVELLPINEFNGNISWGYNPNFYFAPDKAYGTPDDYKRFIDTCHRNGIAVILDIVFNQSDWQHPWYQMYPVGSNPFYNADAPHAYSVLNDWNQGNDMLQKQWHDALRYWIEEYNIDGYRFDLVKGLGNNDSYRNNGDAATNAYNQSRIDRMIELQKTVVAAKPDAYFINEDLADAREENAMGEHGQLNWANINNEGRQYAKGEESGSNLNRFYAPYDSKRIWGSTVSYLESHDEERLAYAQKQQGVIGVKGNTPNSMRRLGCAAAQMILAPGAHMIWQFSEMGNDQTTKNSNGGNNTDPKKVLWSYLDNPNRAGLVQNYRELNGLRKGNPELFAEDAEFTMNCSAQDWSRGRTIINSKAGKELITVINPNVTTELSTKITFSTKEDADYTIYSKSYNTEPTFSAKTGIVTVPANSYVVIGTRNVSTRVEELTADEALAPLPVYGREGAIEIACEEPVEVYAIDGRHVFTGTGTFRADTGIYIARRGTKAIKIAVR